MKSFQKKVAIITGAGSGIGRAISVQLAKEGAMLALTDINAEGLQETVGICESFSAEVFSKVSNVAKIDEVKAFPGATELSTSYVVGKNSPKDFFVKMKFVHTGKKIGNEVCLTYYANAKL